MIRDVLDAVIGDGAAHQEGSDDRADRASRVDSDELGSASELDDDQREEVAEWVDRFGDAVEEITDDRRGGRR